MFKFYRYHFVRRLWFLPAVAIWTYKMLESFLETKKLGAFVGGMEHYLMLPAYLMAIFILTNRAEIEFCQCYGFGVGKLCFAQVGPYVFSTLLAMGAAVVLFPLSAVGYSHGAGLDLYERCDQRIYRRFAGGVCTGADPQSVWCFGL